MKNRRVGAELFHAGRRTDGPTDRQMDRHDKGNSRFSQFFERAQKSKHNYCILLYLSFNA